MVQSNIISTNTSNQRDDVSGRIQSLQEYYEDWAKYQWNMTNSAGVYDGEDALQPVLVLGIELVCGVI